MKKIIFSLLFICILTIGSKVLADWNDEVLEGEKYPEPNIVMILDFKK